MKLLASVVQWYSPLSQVNEIFAKRKMEGEAAQLQLQLDPYIHMCLIACIAFPVMLSICLSMRKLTVTQSTELTSDTR